MSKEPINRKDPFQILESLNQVGVALSSETRLEYLLEMILERAIDIIHADGGTLYTLTKENTLKFSIIRNSSLNIRLGGGGAEPITFPEIPLYKDGIQNKNSISSYCALTKKTINVEDAYTAEGFDFSGAKAFDEKNNYRTRSVLAVPLINHEGKVLGVLQLINCLDSENKPTKFDDFSVKVAESLSSQAAISLQNRLLINQLEGLFEGVTNLINTAIDEKSPYTGGHCLRVPELTLMIADAVDSETEGPLAGFQMTDQDRYELKIAGMLHDCGKITTPVHVVDKATKLETIVDRISMVESKSEILRKEAWIDYWKGINQKAISADQLKEVLEARLQQIDEELAFLRKCNIGGERMQQEDIERLKQIAQQTWVDKNNEAQPYLTDNEVYNLSIPAGTLTKEEREIINYHIVATIKLLEQMDWPDHLKNVTEYAGGHHEKMDGTGYPKGLKRDQMSLQARMMGIADIFEALTASDRPYKKGMPLSQCISIMQRMKQEAHIDPDLFDVFIKHRLHI